MTLGTKIKLLLLLIHAIFIAWIISPNFDWTILVFGGPFIWFFGSKMGMEIGFHRLFSHKSFKTSKFKSRLLLLLGTFSCVGSSLSWVAAHKVHHKHSDKPGDPQNAHTRKRWQIWLGFFGHDWSAGPTLVKDLMRDSWHRFCHNHYFKIVFAFLAGLALLSTVLGTMLPLGIWATSVVMNFNMAGLVNAYCHNNPNLGYRNYETPDDTRNSAVMNALMFFGGGPLHNNHHAHPESYNLNTMNRWYEFDLAGWFIGKYLKSDDILA